jgi:serine/threonine-protein kinase
VLKLAAGSNAWTEVPFGDFTDVLGVAADMVGNVYAAVLKPKQIVVLELPAGASAPSELPFSGIGTFAAVTVDRKGNVYVADFDNNRVLESPTQR